MSEQLSKIELAAWRAWWKLTQEHNASVKHWAEYESYSLTRQQASVLACIAHDLLEGYTLEQIKRHYGDSGIKVANKAIEILEPQFAKPSVD